ncbi:MAG: hypothetical protein V4662_14770 [Verrucomicrobiota bacterium]
MQNVLKSIEFGNEAADDTSPKELESYFVEQDAFGTFLNPDKKLLVVHARKGVGKSALLKWTAIKQRKVNPETLVIECRGSDIARDKPITSGSILSPNDQISEWMFRLFNLVNRELAELAGIDVANHQSVLVRPTDLAKFKNRNLTEALCDHLQSMIANGIHASAEALARIKSYKHTWILIDDLDATYQNTPTESISLATFFSACRYFLQDVKGVSVRVTMRTDVWAMIRRHDESLDKMEQYVHEILWSQRDFLSLLASRVKASMIALGLELPHVPSHVQRMDADERLLQLVFEPRMEWGSEYRVESLGPQREVEAYKIFYTLSYERPRWAIQLCKLARESALNHHAIRITKDHIDEIWGEYGAQRIADLVAEHKHQCRQVDELLNAFRGANRLMTRDELFNWIRNRISNHLEPRIEGVSTRSPRDIAQFLYRIGFILARSERPDRSYEHYRFDQMPDFLTSRTDDDFGLKWEIHPCYREALDIQKLNQSHKERFGRLRKRY